MEVLSYMSLFVEVAKTKNFRKAADTLGISNSTLSRNMTELEKKIGLRLLHRSTRKVELTEAGEAYFRRCQSIVEEARMAHEALLDVAERPGGTLRVSMPVDFATDYLTAILRDFADAYPGIHFDFDLTPRRIDLLAEPFDLVIRIGQAPTAPSMLVARQIALLPRHLYASPSYLAGAPALTSPNDLVHHVLCFAQGGSRTQGEWKTFYRGSEEVNVQVSPRFAMNSVGLSRSLAVLGVGVAILDTEISRQEVALGRLTRVLADWNLAPVQVHAITETRLLPARTKLFIEYLKTRLQAAADIT